MKAVPTTTQNVDERHVSEYSKITLYGCSTRSCYLKFGYRICIRYTKSELFIVLFLVHFLHLLCMYCIYLSGTLVFNLLHV